MSKFLKPTIKIFVDSLGIAISEIVPFKDQIIKDIEYLYFGEDKLAKRLLRFNRSGVNLSILTKFKSDLRQDYIAVYQAYPRTFRNIYKIFIPREAVNTHIKNLISHMVQSLEDINKGKTPTMVLDLSEESLLIKDESESDMLATVYLDDIVDNIYKYLTGEKI